MIGKQINSRSSSASRQPAKMRVVPTRAIRTPGRETICLVVVLAITVGLFAFAFMACFTPIHLGPVSSSSVVAPAGDTLDPTLVPLEIPLGAALVFLLFFLLEIDPLTGSRQVRAFFYLYCSQLC
jgi:hypothetical protein